MSDVKKKRRIRVLLGLGPKHYVNDYIIYKGGEHFGKSRFHNKNQEFCFKCGKFELLILQPSRDI